MLGLNGFWPSHRRRHSVAYCKQTGKDFPACAAGSANQQNVHSFPFLPKSNPSPVLTWGMLVDPWPWAFVEIASFYFEVSLFGPRTSLSAAVSTDCPWAFWLSALAGLRSAVRGERHRRIAQHH